jgi:hypothetical protein
MGHQLGHPRTGDTVPFRPIRDAPERNTETSLHQAAHPHNRVAATWAIDDPLRSSSPPASQARIHPRVPTPRRGAHPLRTDGVRRCCLGRARPPRRFGRWLRGPATAHAVGHPQHRHRCPRPLQKDRQLSAANRRLALPMLRCHTYSNSAGTRRPPTIVNAVPSSQHSTTGGGVATCHPACNESSHWACNATGTLTATSASE